METEMQNPMAESQMKLVVEGRRQMVYEGLIADSVVTAGTLEEGKKWERPLRNVGLDPRDPIPDAMAEYGVDDASVLPSWYNTMSEPKQMMIDGFMGAMTQHQLGSYYNVAKKDGAGPTESLERTFAAWYSRASWLNRDDPSRAFDPENLAFTRGHGKNGSEPSVQEYVQRALKSGDFDFLNDDVNKGVTEPGKRVAVHFHGLDRVQVEGVAPAAKQKAEAALGDFLVAVSEPVSHNGFG